MVDILGLDSLFAEMILAIGLALVAGNAYAFYQHKRGERPDEVEETAPFRTGRVLFLTTVGVLMAAWGGLSIFG